MPAWTVFIKHQSDSSWGIARKWKTFEINKKVRMDSPPEFTATVEYDSAVNFNDLIKFERDSTIEWEGFVEDIEISWDENGRYLNLGGRDITLLLWRKYVENFNNSISGTKGFFGNVNAAELIKFLLRTPRSDLPEVQDDSVGKESIYPYNKEGWGIDISNFTGLEALRNGEGYGDINTTVLRKREMLWANSGSPFNSNEPTNPAKGYEGDVNGLGSTMNWDPHGISPYINADGGTNPPNYVKSHIHVNDTAEFTFAPLHASDNATAINSCFVSIIQAPDGSWDWWDGSNCYVYIWVNSWNSWCGIGNFGGRSSAHGLYDMNYLSWQVWSYDLSNLLKTVEDVNNAKIRFVETGSLSTYIRYCYLSIGYVGLGNIQAGEWVNIMFNPMECMGVYIESREHIDQFPNKYHITTNGGIELFEGYTEQDGDSYITLDAALDKITFDSYQSDNSSKIAYFYRQGIHEGDTDPIGDFDEYISFSISSSQACSSTTSPFYAPAFIPWCLANEVNDFYTIVNGSGNFTCFDVININGVLYPQFRFRSGGSGEDYTTSDVLTIGQTYWLHVTRSGSNLTYGLYNAVTMRDTEKIASRSFSTSVPYTYRYQAITYNHEEWAKIFEANMETIGVGGELFVNGGFETGDTTGWSGDIVINSNPSYVHSGSYSVKVNVNYGIISQSIARGADKDSIENAGFWVYGGGSTDGIYYLYYWDHGPADYDFINWSAPSSGWNYIDILSHLRNDGSQLQALSVMCNQPVTYLDDFSLYIIAEWDSAAGTATRSTNTSKKYQGSGCQQIHCTADGQYFYFEKDLPTSADTVQVDAWLRTPPPHSEGASGDVKVPIGGYHVGYPHFEVWGADPYVRDSGDMNNNHLYFTAQTSVPTAFNDYVTFEELWNTSWGESWYEACIPSYPCDLSVQARIQNNIGGSGTLISVKIQAFLYVAHLNDWVSIGDSGTFTSTSWTDLFTPMDVSSYLTSWRDWDLARVKFTYYGYGGTTGNPAYAQFQIGQVKLNFNGTCSGGRVDLLKVFNSSKGSNPAIGDCAAVVSVRASMYALSSQNYMRYCMGGHGSYIINGEWGDITAGGTTGADFPVPNGLLDSPPPWVHVRLYVHIANGTGYVRLYNITSGSEVLLCQLENLYNTSDGLPDRIDYEAAYWWNYGNSSDYDTYLDAIEVSALTETHTVGDINAGAGPEVTLVTVTDNFYPDLLHSWCPQTISNIKIYADDNEDHGWEITQIYVYKTDPVKYRVVLDSCTALTDEYKLTFNSGSYVNCGSSDNGLKVYHGSFAPANYIGTLLDYDNDKYEWRVDVTGGAYIPQSSDAIWLYTTDGGSGTGSGVLSADAPSVWSGGPYLYLDDANIDLSIFTQDELLMIGPTNIPKNRLLDILWDICVQVNDNYTPFEWWITYPSVGDPSRCMGDFHIGPRRGSDMSATVSFTTGVNMEGVKYQKSSRDTYQRCQLIGTGEGKNQDNCSSFWQNDQDAMDEIQGFFEDIITQKQVSGGRIANRYAKVKLQLDASPKRKNAIICTIGRDTYESGTYDVGDDVTITDILTKVNGNDTNVLRIWNSKISLDDNGEKVVLTVQAPYLDISNIWKDIYKQLKTLGVAGTIAQDWAGQGTQSDKVAADKLTTLFSVTAQNEEIAPQNDDDPMWEISAKTHNADWKADSGNLSIWGGDDASTEGTIWVEAKYNTQYNTGGTKIALETTDITMDQDPKFTCSFKIYQPTGKIWNTDDYVDFGMFHQGKATGFLIRVVCSTTNEFKAYAIYCATEATDYELSLEEMIAAGKAKLLTNLTFNNKYKATITVEYNGAQYGNPLPEVIISVVDEEAESPISRNAVFTKFNSPSMVGGATSVFQSTVIRPIYIFASGKGANGFRCQMNFYNIKCERAVV